MDYAIHSESSSKIEFKDIVLFTLIIAIIITLILNQTSYSIGIKNGFSFCINVLIPSLFPFMFLSSFMIKSEIVNSIGKIFSRVTKFLFYLPGYTAPVIVLGMIGGYPTGAKAVQTLYEQNLINDEQAQRLMCFNVGAGPAFIISVVGEVLLKNMNIGILIFICQISCSVILGMSLGIYARICKYELYEKISQKNTCINISNALIESCQDATNSTINMCSLIILFYSFLSTVNPFLQQNSSFFPPLTQNIIIPTILEVNSACVSISNTIHSPQLIAFAIGWGGICVHLQIISILNKIKSIKIFYFIIFRFIHGLISAILVYTFTHTMCFTAFNTQSTSQIYETPALSTSLTGSFALLLICLYFINNTMSFKKTKISHV